MPPAQQKEVSYVEGIDGQLRAQHIHHAPRHAAGRISFKVGRLWIRFRHKTLTVVAALKIEGIPALIGDFLVTDKLGYDHSWLATRSKEFPYPRPLRRRIRSLCRKLHLINERFIVGFTGSVDVGAVIFAELERLFGKSNTGPSLQEITDALQKFDGRFGADPNILIGWTCRSRLRCFKWKAGQNSSAAAVPYAIEGRGNFADVLTNEGRPHRTDFNPHRTNFNRATGVLSSPGAYSGSVRTAFQKAILLRWLMHERPADPDLVYKTGTQV